MINILLVSSDPGRTQQIAAVIAASGIGHQLKTLANGLPQICADKDALQATDLLIFDGYHLTQDDIGTLEKLSSRHRELVCTLVTPSPSHELLIQAMRAGVRNVALWPIERESFVADLKRVAGRRAEADHRDGQVLSFVSCKGGSGTTFLAANLGHALATLREKRVLFVDLNQQFGDAAHLVCDKAPPATIADVCAQIDRLDASFFDACLTHAYPNFDVLAGAGDPVKAVDIKVSHLEQIVALIRQQYDFVLFDVGQSVNPLSIFALDHSDLIFPVLQSSVPHLRAGKRLLELLQSLGYPGERVRILLNRHEKRGRIDLKTVESVIGARIYKAVPNDARPVLDSVNQGVPVVKQHKSSPISKSLGELAESLAPAPTAASGTALTKLFRSKPRVQHSPA
jgi:pilus assembly protein CpaE